MANKCLGIVICSWSSHDQKTELNSTSTFLSANSSSAWISYNPRWNPQQHWVKSCTPWNQWKFRYVSWARTWLIISPLLESSWAILFISMVFIYFAGKRLPLIPGSDFTGCLPQQLSSLTIQMHLMHPANFRQQMRISNTENWTGMFLCNNFWKDNVVPAKYNFSGFLLLTRKKKTK